MANNPEIVINQSIFRVGCVSSVNGREIKVRVDKQKNLSHIIYKGSIVKIDEIEKEYIPLNETIDIVSKWT